MAKESRVTPGVLHPHTLLPPVLLRYRTVNCNALWYGRVIPVFHGLPWALQWPLGCIGVFLHVQSASFGPQWTLNFMAICAQMAPVPAESGIWPVVSMAYSLVIGAQMAPVPTESGIRLVISMTSALPTTSQ